MFSTLGFEMTAVGFDSLLRLLECAFGRPITIGIGGQVTSDEILICDLLVDGEFSSMWQQDQDGGLQPAIECAVSSLRLLVDMSRRD